MKIYDISQEVFGSVVFPGDPSPKREKLLSIEKGDVCNLTAFSMCAHNGTHVDAPYHFINDGKTVEQIDLTRLVGYAYVCWHEGILSPEDALSILERAEELNPDSAKRILIGGDATVSNEAAQTFADRGILLLGNESQTVGPKDAPKRAHEILLSHDVVLLEGIRLSQVKEGVYLLCAAPISLGGSDGAPVRAVLIYED